MSILLWEQQKRERTGSERMNRWHRFTLSIVSMKTLQKQTSQQRFGSTKRLNSSPFEILPPLVCYCETPTIFSVPHDGVFLFPILVKCHCFPFFLIFDIHMYMKMQWQLMKGNYRSTGTFLLLSWSQLAHCTVSSASVLLSTRNFSSRSSGGRALFPLTMDV